VKINRLIADILRFVDPSEMFAQEGEYVRVKDPDKVNLTAPSLVFAGSEPSAFSSRTAQCDAV